MKNVRLIGTCKGPPGLAFITLNVNRNLFLILFVLHLLHCTLISVFSICLGCRFLGIGNALMGMLSGTPSWDYIQTLLMGAHSTLQFATAVMETQLGTEILYYIK